MMQSFYKQVLDAGHVHVNDKNVSSVHAGFSYQELINV